MSLSSSLPSQLYSCTSGLYQLPQVLVRAGYQRIEPDVVQPLAPYLDNAGEVYRARLVTLNRGGESSSLCLRPDYTVAVARHVIANQAAAAADKDEDLRIAYCGAVFENVGSAGGGKSIQVNAQVGIEHIGAGKPSSERCVAMIETANLLWHEFGGSSHRQAKVGDVGVVADLIDGIGVDAESKRRIWHAMAQYRDAKRVLASLQPRPLPAALATIHQQLSPATTHLAATDAPAPNYDQFAQMAGNAIMSDNVNLGGRSVEDIIAHAWLQYKAARSCLSPLQARALQSILELRCPLDGALDAIADIAADAGIVMDSRLDALRPQLQAIAHCVGGGEAVFEGHPHRALTYYTGITFWISGYTRTQAKVGLRGGEYNSLYGKLGGDGRLGAAGCALTINAAETLSNQPPSSSSSQPRA